MEYSFVRGARDAGERRRFGVWSEYYTNMTRRTIIAAVMVMATVAAAAVIWFWALRPLGAVSYLTSTGASDADIIRQYWPHRLVEPEWVSPTPGRLMNWNLTETVVRLAVVAVLWLFIATGATYELLRGKQSGCDIEC